MATTAKNTGTATPMKKSSSKAGSTGPMTAKPANRAAVNKKAPSAAAPTTARPRPAGKIKVDPDQRRCYIEVAAYYIAERRGFMDGHEAEDWVTAEVEIDQMLSEGKLNG